MKPFQQRNPPCKALVEIQLSAHRGFCNPGHAVAHAGHLRQFVDYFALDQRGVHVECEQSTVAPEDAFALEGDVDREFLRDSQELRAHVRFARWIAGNSELDARICTGVLRRKLRREAVDAVDVHPVGGDDPAHARQLNCGYRSPQGGDDEVLMMKAVNPAADCVRRNDRESRQQSKGMGAVMQRRTERSPMALLQNFQKNSQGESLVNDRLADVEDTNVVSGQRAGELRGEPWLVRSREMDKEGFFS